MVSDESQKIAFRDELDRLVNKELQKSQIWFLVDMRWYKQLRRYLGDDGGGNGQTGASSANDGLEEGLGGAINDEEDGLSASHPGPVDNSNILDPLGNDIREHLIENMDYQLLPSEAWEKIVEMFGIAEGQKPISRKVIELGMFVKTFKVEVYFIELMLAQNSDIKATQKAKFSKNDVLKKIVKKMREIFSIPESKELRLWNKYTGDTYEMLSNVDGTTVQEAGLYNGQLLVIELQNEDGTWPRAAKSTSVTLSNDKANGATSKNITSISSSSTVGGNSGGNNGVGGSSGPVATRYAFSAYNDPGQSEKAQPGLCGLSNLGNTCFMNSIIQGLSNCPPITEYFAGDNYVEDINEDNPLGMKGEIARAFGELIKSLWSGRYSFFVPRNFKTAVGRFAPQFSGYQQQDSQELLTFLLDGLHEDLNRIKKKPYLELKDSDGRPDEEVAAEAWDMYKKRNDSVILDLFHGLLKSTVVCPECPKVSVTFDPFCYLSLPLPVRKERRIDVFLVYADPQKPPKQFKVTVIKAGVMLDLCKALSALCGVEPNKMVVTDVYNHRFHKIYGPDEALTHILDRDDIFIYEVTALDLGKPSTVVVPVYLREKKTSVSYSPSNLFGQPMLLEVPSQGISYEELYHLALKKMSRLVKPIEEGEIWWKKPKASPAPTAEHNGERSVPDGAVASSTSSTVDDAVMEDTNGDEEDEEDDDDDDDEEEEEEEEEEDGKGPPKLFVMNFVNSYGNAQLEHLNNDGKPIKISGKTYLSLDWHSKAKDRFYDERESEKFDPDPSLDAKPAPKKVVQLEECLELYTSTEKLGENDAWYCPSCKKHQQATKKFDLWSLPALLVISLKRFSYNRYWRDKLDTHTEFPVDSLDMTPYVINPAHGRAVYDLVAVSNHYGGMGGGHYTAYAKNKDDNNWYYYDDSNVSPASKNSVVSKAAYVLFYQRRDLATASAASVTSAAATATSSSHIQSTAVCNGQKINGESSSIEDMDTN